MKSKGFEGIWIPREVFEIEELTIHQKVIYSMIQNLSSDQPCYASNKYIGQILNLSERSVSTHISALKSLGYIYYERPRNINGEWSHRLITIRHKQVLVKGIPKPSAGSEETTIPKPSSNSIVIHNKEYNINDLDDSKRLSKDKESESFDIFWKTIPPIRRINKPLTKKHWLVATHKESVEAIQEAMELYVDRLEPQYIKTSHNWLKLEYYKSIPPIQEKISEAMQYR
jgi:DNA-binding transcriptional ArsR family regulator